MIASNPGRSPIMQVPLQVRWRLECGSQRIERRHDIAGHAHQVLRRVCSMSVAWLASKP